MKYNVVLSRNAVRQFSELTAFERAKVKKGMSQYLSTAPTLLSKSRIKLLRPPAPAQYRLRLDDLRVYYDVDDTARIVEVIGIIEKRQAEEWFARESGDETD